MVWNNMNVSFLTNFCINKEALCLPVSQAERFSWTPWPGLFPSFPIPSILCWDLSTIGDSYWQRPFRCYKPGKLEPDGSRWLSYIRYWDLRHEPDLSYIHIMQRKPHRDRLVHPNLLYQSQIAQGQRFAMSSKHKTARSCSIKGISV